MGWTSYYRPPTDPKAELIRIIQSTGQDGPTYEVVQTSKRSTTFYFAVKITPSDPSQHCYGDYKPDADGSYTIGVVAQTNRYRGEWGYKLIEETQGPTLADAPISMIERLSQLPMFPDNDTGADWATKWRARCINNTKARSKRKMADGDLIRFAEQVTFEREGVGKSRTFRVRKEARWNGRKRTVFICQDTDTRCRITGFSTMAYTTLERGAGHG